MAIVVSRVSVIPPAGSSAGRSNVFTVTAFLRPFIPFKETFLVRDIPGTSTPDDYMSNEHVPWKNRVPIAVTVRF